MNFQTSARKIDMALIESLKQRRKEADNQLRGEELDKLTDLAISSI